MNDISEYIISTLLVLKNNVYEVHRYNTRRKFLDLHPEIEQYLNVWTVKDPQKRKIAKENNLNFLEIWSLKNIENII